MKRKILPFLATFLVLTFVYGAWIVRPFDAEREFGPLPTLPTPNGLDGCLRAYGQIEEVTMSFGRRNKRSIDPMLEYRAGINPKSYSSAERAAWLAQASKGFETLGSALDQPFQIPVFRPQYQDATHMEAFQMRDLAKYVALRSKVLDEQGDHYGAAAAGVDTIELGVKMRVNANVIDSLYASICESYGHRALSTQIAYLNPSQAAMLARRLERINATRPPFSQTLRAEKLAIAFLAETATKAPLQQIPVYGDSERSSISPNRLTSFVANGVARTKVHKVHRFIDGALPRADVAWAQREIFSPAEGDTEAQVLVKSLESRFFVERSATMANQCLIRLALHAHRKTTGVYPQTLAELSPRYLSKLPPDTFASAPMRYKVENNRYTLWSVGPDARDDGARPIEDQTKTKLEARFTVRRDSTGDIVANINT